MGQLPQEVSEAIRLFKANQCDESRKALQDYLVNKSNGLDALLWLAKVSGNSQEAMDAAELACFLQPDSEVAQRAVAAISNQIPEDDTRIIELNLLKLTGMTETQARAVIWPFKGVNRPIGILLDEKGIELRDVAWASENAHDPILQKAARTLLLSSVFRNRLKDSPQPAKVIEGRENAEYQERIASLKAGFLSATAFVVYLFSLALFAANKFFAFTSDTTITTIFLVTFVIGLLLLKPISQATDNVENYKVGRQGERKAVDFLRVSLHTPWVLVHNLEFPNRKWGDADIVLVGPGGV